MGERDANGGHNAEQILDLMEDIELLLVRLLYGDASVTEAVIVETMPPTAIPNSDLHELLLDQN